MNKQSSSKLKWIIFAVIVIIAALLYFSYSGSSAPAGSTTLQAIPGGAGDVGANVVAMLNEIRSLRIDKTLFTDPAYQTLQDYSVTIPELNVGRANPFAPIPGYQPPVQAKTH